MQPVLKMFAFVTASHKMVVHFSGAVRDLQVVQLQ